MTTTQTTPPTTLTAHYGEEEVDRLLTSWRSSFAPYRNWIAALGEHAEEPAQIGWTFTPATRETIDREGDAAV